MPGPNNPLPNNHVIVISGGDALCEAEVRAALSGSLIMAADSGADRALEAGLTIDVLVGDFDSISPATLAQVKDSGCRVMAHPREKDETDLELALVEAALLKPDQVTVLSMAGGRPDHFLSSIMLLADPRFSSTRVVGYVGPNRLEVIHHEATLEGNVGDLVSLVATGGSATGITTTGLRYPLLDETLTPFRPRGVSNELVDTRALISLRSGTLLAFQPVVQIHGQPQ